MGGAASRVRRDRRAVAVAAVVGVAGFGVAGHPSVAVPDVGRREDLKNVVVASGASAGPALGHMPNPAVQRQDWTGDRTAGPAVFAPEG